MGGAAGLTAFGTSWWRRVAAQPYTPGDGPYGPLQPPDANGIQLPQGFTSRVIGQAGVPVEGTTYQWLPYPDGSGTFADPEVPGGWYLVVNSESPPPIADRDPSPIGLGEAAAEFFESSTYAGGVSSVRFAPDGTIVSAQRVLDGTQSNCAGTATPWGTWLSCEEFDFNNGHAGQVWEVDPFGSSPAVVRPAMGLCKHEMVAIDEERRRMYLSEDQSDGLLYRFTPSSWGDLSAGLLEAAHVAEDGSVTWHPVPDPSSASAPIRVQLADVTTSFDGGEGCTYADGAVYLTTKNDHRVWRYDVVEERIEVIYDDDFYEEPVLRGVDNIKVSTAGDILVAEDRDNMEIVMLTPEGTVSPLLRMTGPQHGVRPLDQQFEQSFPAPFNELPTVSEVTGIALTPDGSRLYCNSQRAWGSYSTLAGVTYEISGPFRTEPPTLPVRDPGDLLAAPPRPGGVIPASGGEGLAGGVPGAAVGLAALGGALVAWRGRGRPEAHRESG